MKLSEVYREICVPLAEATGKPVVIAGGAVRDHLLGRRPHDYDIYVLGGKLGPPMRYKAEKEVKAFAMALSGATSFATHSIPKSYGWDEFVTPPKGGEVGGVLLADIVWRSAKVQLMLSQHKDANHLLGTFDWSICGYAYNGGYVYHLAAPSREKFYSTPLGLINAKPRDPLKTLKRGYIFAERYGIKFPSATQRMLCKLVVDGDKAIKEVVKATAAVEEEWMEEAIAQPITADGDKAVTPSGPVMAPMFKKVATAKTITEQLKKHAEALSKAQANAVNSHADFVSAALAGALGHHYFPEIMTHAIYDGVEVILVRDKLLQTALAGGFVWGKAHSLGESFISLTTYGTDVHFHDYYHAYKAHKLEGTPFNEAWFWNTHPDVKEAARLKVEEELKKPATKEEWEAALKEAGWTKA